MDDKLLEIKERRGKEMRRAYDLIDDHMEHCRCSDCIRFRTLHESDADIDFLLGEVERLREACKTALDYLNEFVDDAYPPGHSTACQTLVAALSGVETSPAAAPGDGEK